MDKNSKKVESVKSELTELNKKFHEKSLLDENFYRQLMQAGFAYRRCMLVSVFPDSGRTYCGIIIRQDGNVVAFDIDLENAESSSWKDVTDEFRSTFKKNWKARPWLKEVVASSLFDALQESFSKA